MHSEPNRLLKFLASFHIGGTEGQVLNLARGLDPARFELRFGFLHRAGELLQEIEQRWTAQEFPVSSFLHHRAWQQQWNFARYVRAHGIDIVHAYGFYGNVFAVPAARLAGIPVVLASIRDRGDYLSPMQKRAQRLACKLATRVLANSDAVREKLIEEGYTPEKIVVIRNGITLSSFRERNGRKLLGEFGVPDQAPVVAVVSRLSELKGIDDFLIAAPRISERFPQARFVIVGDGDYRAQLERRAGQLGLHDRVVFTGFRTDIPQVLSEVSVSVLPSLSEGLSNTLLESMAAGVPVVATKVGGNPEAVAEGTTGLLVSPRDASGLAEAVCTLLKNQDLAHRFGEAGRERVARLFSIETMVRTTERLYLTLLDARQAKRRQEAWG